MDTNATPFCSLMPLHTCDTQPTTQSSRYTHFFGHRKSENVYVHILLSITARPYIPSQNVSFSFPFSPSCSCTYPHIHSKLYIHRNNTHIYGLAFIEHTRLVKVSTTLNAWKWRRKSRDYFLVASSILRNCCPVEWQSSNYFHGGEEAVWS